MFGLLLACVAGGASAQSAGLGPRWDVVVAVGPTPDAQAQADWLRLIERNQTRGTTTVGVTALGEALGLPVQAIDRQDLASLALVEAHLTRARAHTAQLAEAAALTELVAAERRLQSLLHVPASSAFYVEVQTAIAIVAAQAGRVTLAEAAQRRAVVVDPDRGVRAAEAAPGWVERAARIAREVATAPVGEIEVSTSPSGARVYVDDTLIGTTPTTLRVTRGVHVLRLESDGYRTFGTLLPVDAGVRPAVHVGLVRDPMHVALSGLTAAALDSDRVAVRRALSALQALGVPVVSACLLQTHPARADRALVTRCTVDACEPTQRLERDATAHAVASATDRTQLRDLDWLTATPPHAAVPAAAPVAWWRRWYVWTAASLVVGAGVAVGAAAASEPDSQRLRVTVEP